MLSPHVWKGDGVDPAFTLARMRKHLESSRDNRLLWNLQFTLAMCFKIGWDIKFCWGIAVASDDSYTEGLSPEDAVYEELSCWD